MNGNIDAHKVIKSNGIGVNLNVLPGLPANIRVETEGSRPYNITFDYEDLEDFMFYASLTDKFPDSNSHSIKKKKPTRVSIDP